MNSAARDEQQHISGKISSTVSHLHQLESALQVQERELAKAQEEAPKYEALAKLIEQLRVLDEMGGNHLVWGDDHNKEQALAHIEQLQSQLCRYNDSITAIHQEKSRIAEQIRTATQEVSLLNEAMQEIKENKEERKYEFVVVREFVKRQYRPTVMPWSKGGEDEKRFRKILYITVCFCLLISVIIPLVNLPIPERAEVVEIPERLAKLVVEKKEPPKPKEEPKPQDLPEKEKRPNKDTPKPQTEEAKVARQKAERSGILAFKDNFSELMESAVDKKLGANASLSNSGATASQTQRSIVAATVAGASGGINTSSLSRNVAGSGKGISGVAFSRVESNIGTDFAGEERKLNDGPGPSRTDEEIQIVFDRYKAALYRIYNRQLRTDPTLQGKIVLRITIQPDGTVSHCKVESTDMHSVELGVGIVERVKRFNFGPKEGVPPVTILYPIDFLPAN